MARPDERHEEARAAAFALLSSETDADMRVPGYAATLADIAAHLVADAVQHNARIRTHRPPEGLLRSARDAISLMADAIRRGLPGAGAATGGVVGRAFELHSSYVTHYDRSWQLSGSVPRLFFDHPATTPDLAALRADMAQRLAAKGHDARVTDRLEVMQGRSPYSRDRSDHWTSFRLPADDRRATLEQHVAHLEHISTTRREERLQEFAENFHLACIHADRISRLLDETTSHALDVMDDPAGLVFLDVDLHSVTRSRSGVHASIRATFQGLSEALAPREVEGVYTAPIDGTMPRTHNMKDMLAQQRELRRVMKRRPELVIDGTGRRLLETLGMDVAGIVAEMVATHRSVRSIPGDDNVTVRIDAGRVTANGRMARDVYWRRNELEVRATFPDAVAQTLAGRCATLVVDHPALEGTVIGRARVEKRRTLVSVKPRWEKLP
jgi:hypothetical protein